MLPLFVVVVVVVVRARTRSVHPTTQDAGAAASRAAMYRLTFAPSSSPPFARRVCVFPSPTSFGSLISIGRRSRRAGGAAAVAAAAL